MTQSLTYSSRPCRVRVFLALLAGDDGGDALVLEPAEEPPELGPHDALVRKAGEERLDGVQDHALGADRVDHGAQTDEQALEVVFAGLFDLAPLDRGRGRRPASCA